MKIPENTSARELFSMFYHGYIPKSAPPEDLHAALCQVAAILADHEDMLSRLFELVEPLDRVEEPLAESPGATAVAKLRTIFDQGLEAAEGVVAELAAAIDPSWPTDEQMAEAWQSFQKRHEAAGGEEVVLVPKAGPVTFPRFKVAGKRADGVPILEPAGHEVRRWRCRSCSWSCGIWLGPWIRPCVAECPDCGGEATYRGAFGGVTSGTYSGEEARADVERPKPPGQFGSAAGVFIGAAMEKLIGKGDVVSAGGGAEMKPDDEPEGGAK